MKTAVNIDDWLCVNKPLACDDPNNKKGFTFKGMLYSPCWIKIFDIKEFNGTLCAVVKVYHHVTMS